MVCAHMQVIAGNNSPDLLPEEIEWEGRKERMAQMEAVLMSAIHHPNIVNTYKKVEVVLLGAIHHPKAVNTHKDPETGNAFEVEA
eukprot:scaffold161511_cov18-Tisochrysis_lutea.AAC.6